MPYNKIDELPSQVREQLPEHAQQMFLAAFNSAQSDGMDENAAMQVGWSSLKSMYKQGQDGKWYQATDDTAVHNKAISSGGN